MNRAFWRDGFVPGKPRIGRDTHMGRKRDHSPHAATSAPARAARERRRP
jgi:hypothetical protein